MADSKRTHQKGYKNLMSPEAVNTRCTPEQIKERCSKAGKASAQKKRDTRTLKEIALELMAAEARPEALQQYGLPEGTSNAVVMMVAAYTKAQAGDVRAQEYIRDTMGQMPTKEVNLSAEVFTEADKKLLEKVSKRLKASDQEQS